MNIAVITGASSGLGVKFLDAIIKKYPNLDEYWIIARRRDRLETLARKYAPKKIVPIEADLSDENAYAKIADRLKLEQPNVRNLINNAGYERSGAFSSMQEKDILNMISLNIKGMTMMQRICLPYMQAGSFSVITCSVSAFVPVPNQTIYAASKKYVYYFGKALREELLAKKINVLLLCPGNMDTEMNPRGQGRQSQKINGLPFLNMDKLTWKALELAERGKGVYTPGWFYKGYRITAKLVPSAWMMKIVKKFY